MNLSPVAARQGAAEVIGGQSKAREQIAGSSDAMRRKAIHNVQAIRIGQEAADSLTERFPLRYEPLLRLTVAMPAGVRRPRLHCDASGDRA